MRRIINTFFTLATFTLAATACDVAPEQWESEQGALSEGLRSAETPAEVSVVSWAHEASSIRSKAYCADFIEDDSLPGKDDCLCADDDNLSGQINHNTGSDQCVLCRWWQWDNGDCELDTPEEVHLNFVSNGGSQYSYADDGIVTNIDTSEPWVLSCEDNGGSCSCDGNSCSCTDEMLDFAVVRVSGSGTLVSDPSAVIGLSGC